MSARMPETFVGCIVEGWTVVEDVAYCGFDGGIYGAPESYGRFWCRRVTARAPWGDTASTVGPDIMVLAKLRGGGVMRHDGEHVLVSLARIIAPLTDAHHREEERLRWAKEGHRNWRLSADGTRGEWIGGPLQESVTQSVTDAVDGVGRSGPE